MFLQDNELLTFELPSTLLPGRDILSKRILKNQKVIDLIINSLLNIPAGTYGVASSEWLDNTRSDTLYEPRLDIQKSLPPVLIEVQARVDEKFMMRLMQYAINVIERYDLKPVVLIFCVDKISSKSLSAQFTQNTNNQRYLRSFPSPVWAQQCFLVFENNDDVGSYPLETLQAISSFFCQQKATLYDHSYSEDNTIKFLYKIAKEVTVEETQYESNVRHTLDIVLTSNEKFLNRIKKSLTGVPDIKKAERLIEKGLTYNASVKRQLSDISTDSESDLEFPEKLPVRSKRPPTTPQLADEIAFVKRFKAKVGRMNWTQCLTEAHENHLLLRYSTGSSLRANFSKHVKP
ncbi:hypothetical protein INT47_001895 [Mucor saturninus]|uniref:Transposase n=1 Tax=Mucor saturninus TaxID=64648 RepID=A0A8H7REZ1_9FUNG|nr:hypothetical protein INT47_001895 [Mucor saturninus]